MGGGNGAVLAPRPAPNASIPRSQPDPERCAPRGPFYGQPVPKAPISVGPPGPELSAIPQHRGVPTRPRPSWDVLSLFPP